MNQARETLVYFSIKIYCQYSANCHGCFCCIQGKLVAEVLAAMRPLASLQPWIVVGSPAPSDTEANAQPSTVLLGLLLDKLLNLEDNNAQVRAICMSACCPVLPSWKMPFREQYKLRCFEQSSVLASLRMHKLEQCPASLPAAVQVEV